MPPILFIRLNILNPIRQSAIPKVQFPIKLGYHLPLYLLQILHHRPTYLRPGYIIQGLIEVNFQYLIAGMPQNPPDIVYIGPIMQGEGGKDMAGQIGIKALFNFQGLFYPPENLA